MALSELLEEFSTHVENDRVDYSEVMIEDLKLEAFEKGYQAGWDDSAKSQAESVTRASEGFLRQLDDLSFTYQEAYAAMLAEIEPVIRELVDRVLPELARKTMGLRVAELVQENASSLGKVPICVRAAPRNASALGEIVENQTRLPLEIEEDDSLGKDQVHLRFGTQMEREIDMSDMLERVSALIEDFFQTNSIPTYKESA